MKNIYLTLSIVLGLLTTKTLSAQDFITIWNPNSDTIEIPINNDYISNYNYDIEWFSLDGPTPVSLGNFSNVSYDLLITNLAPYNTIEVVISGDFPAIFMGKNSPNNAVKLVDIKQWGNNPWQSFENAFAGCTNLTVSALDAPNLTNVTDMSYMFFNAENLNSDFNNWDVSGVLNMEAMFQFCTLFNGNISNWDVGEVKNMNVMFADATHFNQNIGGWDVSKVESMIAMFAWTSDFNQDIGNWNVSMVSTLEAMFYNATAFNQDIGAWDVGSVTDMDSLFFNASDFNQDIGGWNVGMVENMNGIFTNATNFNQSLEDWNIYSATSISLSNCGMDCINYSRTLHGWAIFQGLPSGIILDAAGLEYSGDQITLYDISTLTNTAGLNWTITGSPTEGSCTGVVTNEFIGIWNTIGPDSDDNLIYIPASGDYTYSYTQVDASYDPIGQTQYGSNVNGDTLYFPTPGLYRIEITPDDSYENPLNRINYNNGYDKDKILLIEQWGNFIPWSSLQNAYYGCSNLDVTATDVPKLTYVTNTSYAFAESGLTSLPNFNNWDMSNVTDASYMFKDVSGFIPDVENWDVSNITNMSGMFSGAYDFNQDISGWDVSNVTNMSDMFNGATNFNQDLSGWDVSQVTDMSNMFAGASSITDIAPSVQDGALYPKDNGIEGWDVGQVVNMNGMFSNATQFTGDIGGWDVGQVTDMGSMFEGAQQFNGGIEGWDVGQVTNMEKMFKDATQFNGGIEGWDVGQVTNMEDLFSGATNFNQDIGGWDVGQLGTGTPPVNNDISFANSGMDCNNYSRTINGWALQSGTASDITVDATGMEYSPNIITARDMLLNDRNWTINGDTEGTCYLSVDEFKAASFTIYPNPTQFEFTITGLTGNETIQLTDMTGRVLQTVKNKNNATESINVSQLANGVYSLTISTENGQKATQKLIKQ